MPYRKPAEMVVKKDAPVFQFKAPQELGLVRDRDKAPFSDYYIPNRWDRFIIWLSCRKIQKSIIKTAKRKAETATWFYASFTEDNVRRNDRNLHMMLFILESLENLGWNWEFKDWKQGDEAYKLPDKLSAFKKLLEHEMFVKRQASAKREGFRDVLIIIKLNTY